MSEGPMNVMLSSYMSMPCWKEICLACAQCRQQIVCSIKTTDATQPEGGEVHSAAPGLLAPHRQWTWHAPPLCGKLQVWLHQDCAVQPALQLPLQCLPPADAALDQSACHVLKP